MGCPWKERGSGGCSGRGRCTPLPLAPGSVISGAVQSPGASPSCCTHDALLHIGTKYRAATPLSGPSLGHLGLLQVLV